MKAKRFQEELIGREVKVIASRNSSIIGIKGKVVDETKSSLVIETKRGRKRVLKASAVFEMGGAMVPGTLLRGTLVERLQK